jgi:hypothetical protein
MDVHTIADAVIVDGQIPDSIVDVPDATCDHHDAQAGALPHCTLCRNYRSLAPTAILNHTVLISILPDIGSVASLFQ